VQASKLWYEKLKVFVRKQGYVHGDVDPCVFKKVADRNVYLLLVYVDDILIIGEEQEIRRLETEFLKAFRWITMSVGHSHSYIGMQVSVRDGKVTLDRQSASRRNARGQEWLHDRYRGNKTWESG
jgi:hypothetical protein